MEIKVLGSGYSRCHATHEIVREIVAENNIDATVEYVTDIMQVMSYNVMTMPAIVIDGQVVFKGRVPTRSQVKELLGL